MNRATHPQIEYLAKVAVIDHYRWWVWVDAAFLQEIKKTGRLTEDLVDTIAYRYGTSRTLPADKAAVARHLNELADHWPDSLHDRCEQVCKTAEQLSKLPKTGKTPWSAVSKLIWFLKPKGWTMYDNLAATGLGVSKPNDGRIKRFYAALADKDFEGCASRIQEILDKRGLQYLHGERVIDKFLMHAGPEAGDGSSMTRYLPHLLETLPAPLCGQLLQAATESVGPLAKHFETIPALERP